LKFGVGIDPVGSHLETVGLAKLAEESKYELIWICDERFHREIFSTMALCAANTKKVKIGTAVTDPYIRHPAMTALAIATVDEISEGRVILNLGAGYSGFNELCIERKKPALALREAICIMRRLFQGEKVQYDGQIFKVNGVRIDFESRSDIPIYIAGRGPKILELAGEIADGVMIGAFASEKSLSHAFEQIERGARSTGRSIQQLELVSWAYTAISENGKLAKDIIRPFIMYMIASSWPGDLEKAGVSEDIAKPVIQSFSRLSEKGKLSFESEEFKAAASALIPDEYVDDFSVSGTPDECIEKVKELARLGITQVAILPFTVPGQERSDVIRDFATKVASSFHC
jgi:5,10-methylenetetrahydromethanopterin reductase